MGCDASRALPHRDCAHSDAGGPAAPLILQPLRHRRQLSQCTRSRAFSARLACRALHARQAFGRVHYSCVQPIPASPRRPRRLPENPGAQGELRYLIVLYCSLLLRTTACVRRVYRMRLDRVRECSWILYLVVQSINRRLTPDIRIHASNAMEHGNSYSKTNCSLKVMMGCGCAVLC